MKIERLDEVRANTHQQHFEDLVLFGVEGLNELNDKIEKFAQTLEGQDVGLNTTVKIDGAPAVFCWHKFPGYPDDSISLKGFVNGAKNAISSVEDIYAKYNDRPSMSEMLEFCLEIAKHIPAGECWQGDCLFVSSTKSEQEILGKDYITFQPNKIVYAFSGDNPGYEQVKNADFGIAFHTIYKGTQDNLSQSFRVDPTRIDVPSNIYIMSPALNASNKKEDYKLDEILELYDELKTIEASLENDPAYEELVNNKEFLTFWQTFENKTLADNKATNINPDLFIDELQEHLEDRIAKGRVSKVGAVRLINIINTKQSTLTNIVKAINKASEIKMLLWGGYKNSKTDYNTFYRSRSNGYIPAGMEGIAMSDSDGNIVKIVDRSSFSNVNRDPDYMSGFEHESLQLGEDMHDKGEIVFAFGRMNPPTKGHEKLIRFMGDISAENKPRIYLSHSQDKKRNPLSYEDKIKFVKKLGEPEVDVVDSDLRELLYIVVALQQEGFSKITLVCGNDRRQSFYDLLLNYNGKILKNGSMYKFPEENIDVISAGDRDPDSDDPLIRASATNMRKYASNNDFESFKENSPFDEQTSKELFTKVRKGLLLENMKILKENNDEYDKFTQKRFSGKSLENLYDELLGELTEKPEEVKQVINVIHELTNSLDDNVLKSAPMIKGKLREFGKEKLDSMVTDLLKVMTPKDAELIQEYSINPIKIEEEKKNSFYNYGLSKKLVDVAMKMKPFRTGAGEVLLTLFGGKKGTIGDININDTDYEVKETTNSAAFDKTNPDNIEIDKLFKTFKEIKNLPIRLRASNLADISRDTILKLAESADLTKNIKDKLNSLNFNNGAELFNILAKEAAVNAARGENGTFIIIKGTDFVALKPEALVDKQDIIFDTTAGDPNRCFKVYNLR